MEKVIANVSGNRVLPVSVELAVEPTEPPFYSMSVKGYFGLKVQKKEGWKNTYLTALRAKVSTEDAFYEGGIVAVTVRYYRTRRDNASHTTFFVVTPSKRAEVETKFEHVKLVVCNLVPIEFDEFKENEVKSEILNTYNALPSEYDPVLKLYYAFKVLGVLEEEKDGIEELEALIREKKELIEKLEEEVRELEAKLANLRLEKMKASLLS